MHAALKAAGTVVGQGRYADGNQITVDTGGRLETGSLEIGYGYGANGNRVNVWPGGVLIAEEVRIGRTGNSGNALLLYRDADLTVGMIKLASKNSIGFQSPGTLDFALLSDWLSAGRVPLYVNGTRVTADNMKRLLYISVSGDITFFTAAPFIFTHMTEIIAVAAAVLLAGAVIFGWLWYRRRRAAGEERRWRKETWLSNWYEDCQRRKRQQQRRGPDRREE